MGCSTPGFLVLHYLPEFVQVHVHWVGDAIQPLWKMVAWDIKVSRLCVPEDVKFLSLKLKWWFRYRMLGWISFPFRILKAWLYYFLTLNATTEESKAIFVHNPFNYFFSLEAYRNLVFVASVLKYHNMCLVVKSVFIHFAVHWMDHSNLATYVLQSRVNFLNYFLIISFSLFSHSGNSYYSDITSPKLSL